MPADDNEVHAQDLHLRHTSTTGESHVFQHRVWNADRFIAAQQRAARDMNAAVKDKDAPRLARVDLITAQQYRIEKAAS